MRKIFLLLFATIVSLAAMAQLNPYAYNLSSNWDETKQILTVNFKLNAHPNLDVTANGNGTGIQIFAVDRDNNNKMYYIHGIPAAEIRKKIDSGDLDYSVKIPINGRSIEPDECLPKGKNLTFAVRVQGVNSKNKTVPGNVVYTGNRPFSPHGVAVNNCQDSQDFGAVYVTECTNGVSGNATWGWLSGKGQSLLEYDPQLEYVVSHQKSSPFSQRNFKSRLLEPHRVRVSDDGDVYVSSYNIQSSNSTPVVWKYNKTKNDFDPVIYHNTSYGDRVFGMAVRGSGSSTTILLLYLEENTGQSLKQEFRVYEYSLNNLGANKNVASKKCWYTPGSEGQTIMTYWTQNLSGQTSPYYVYSEGFANVAYRANSSNDVFFMLDYFYDKTWNARMVYYQGQNAVSYQTLNKDGHYYGGGSLLTYKYDNVEYIVSGRTSKNGYSGSYNNPDDGRINVYKFDPTLTGNNNNDKIASNCTYTIQTRTASVINDFAMDCANNLYAVSFTDATGEDGYDSSRGKYPAGTGTLLAVPMPYSGTVTTYCPTSNTDDKEYFQLPARTELPENLTSTALDRIANNNSGGCGCNISLNRPMQADMFSTICLPFDLNISSLPDDHPYKNADILAFDDVVLSADDNGNILELSFVPINGQMVKNTPYLIRPKGGGISDKVLFDNVTIDSYKGFSDPAYLVTKNNVTFWGMIPSTSITLDPENDVVLILVADNRLAKTTGGSFLGLRGFFYYDKRQVPANAGARIAERKSTPTSVINLNGEQVDIQKFLREGRVYIRMGETLYSIDGVKVE